MLREGPEARELLVFQHAGMPEASLQVPGGTVEQGETPIEAVAREVLEESGLPLDGWQSVVTLETGGRRWHCFATAPADPLPDSWSWEPAGGNDNSVWPHLILRSGPTPGAAIKWSMHPPSRRR